MKKSFTKDCLVVGFAVFAMFFGAGNLIFPAGIGAAAGTQWPIALFATVLASIVMPLLGLFAAAKTGNGYEGICAPVGNWYYKLTFIFCAIFISGTANLPRTAATTHEMSIAPYFPQIPIQATVIVYFLIVLFLVFDRNNIVDRIGKYLTPLLLVLMVAIIVKGFITPIGTVTETAQTNVFGSAFVELYMTGDLFSGLMFSEIVVSAILAKGYQKGKELNNALFLASAVAGVAFLIIYGDLLVIGANANSVFGDGMDRTALLTGITQRLLGGIGGAALAISVALACLSTAAALVSVGANFFSNLVRNKLSYKAWAVIFCAVGSVIGSMGVENIISFAGPVFLAIYPSGIVLTIVGLMGKYCPNRGAYKYSVLCALVCGCLDSLTVLGVPGVGSVTGMLPLAGAGFGWVVPSAAGFVVGWIKYQLIPEKTPVENA